MRRQTAQLKGVLAVLDAAGEALSAEQIWQAASRSLSLNRVTVYRIIKRLVDSGELETNLSGRSRLYRRPHDHPHFYCRECGRRECLEGAGLDLEQFKLLVDAQVEHVAIRLEGRCRQCRKP